MGRVEAGMGTVLLWALSFQKDGQQVKSEKSCGCLRRGWARTLQIERGCLATPRAHWRFVKN